MRVEFDRVTIGQEIRLSGTGIHSGEQCQATIMPGKDRIRFVHLGSVIDASAENVSKTPRSTWLGTVRTIEHLMSAFAGLEITDADVVVEGSELPILDGGSREFCQALMEAGKKRIGRTACQMFGRVQMTFEGQSISIAAGSGCWKYLLKSSAFPGDQTATFQFGTGEYLKELAPARTWCFERDLPEIERLGLGKGGSLQNTLIIGDGGYRNEPHFENEPARHKLLDCLGDLALAGVPARFLEVAAEASGHTMHVKAAARLKQLCFWEDLATP